MPSPTTVRLGAVGPAFLQRATPTAVEDWLAYVDPDGVVLTGTDGAPRAMNTLRRACSAGTVLFDPSGSSGESGPRTIDGVQFVFAPSLTDIEAVGSRELTSPTYIVSDLLELDIDTTTLSTALVGKDPYSDAVDAGGLDGQCVHLSTRLPAEYRRQWDGLQIVGVGTGAGTDDNPLVALDCRSDGRVLTRTVRPDRFGLQALDRVGPSRARTLREAGYTSRALIGRAGQTELAELSGIGSSTAARIQQSAEAISRGEIVRTGTGQLPAGEPVFIDIETDGLSPTITWLVGVLDGSSAEGEYSPFLQTDPDEPGGAVAAFMAWYTANASHRPLVAYNGWRFDFEVLHDAIREHCPGYEDAWTSTYRFDPYQWAVEDGHAILPGRTNKLEDVAAALGYNRGESGLTGAAVARRYRQWMADRDTEPEWGSFERYCEDDVRALAVVYEALEASGRIVSSDDGDRTGTTTQGTLSEW